jgi:hypothetical protein
MSIGFKSQTRIVRSKDPETIRGLGPCVTATAQVSRVCPSPVARRLPVVISQALMDPSEEAEITTGWGPFQMATEPT